MQVQPPGADFIAATQLESPRTAVAKAICRYGKTFYDIAERDIAKRAYCISFVLLAYKDTPPPSLGFTEAHFRQILQAKSIDDAIRPENIPSDFEQQLRAVDPQAIQRQIRGLSLDDQLEVATTIRWLEHCYQNLEAYKALPHEPNDLFQVTIGIAREILSKLPQEVKDSEEFELDYNTSHYLYRREHPGDIDGVLALLKNLLERYKHDPQKQSRICNLLACFTPSERVKEVYENAQIAHRLKVAHPERFEPFLHAVGKSNFVAACLRYPERKETMEELHPLMLEAMQYVKAETDQGNFNDYFPSICLNCSKLMIAMDNKQEAIHALSLAGTILQKCPDPDPDPDDLALFTKLANQFKA